MTSHKSDRGAAAVEFALVMPVLLAIVFGLIDLGAAYHAKVALTHATREGARTLALAPTASTAPAQAKARTEAAATGLKATKLTVPLPTACSSTVTNATVTANYTYELLTPLSGILQIITLGNPPLQSPMTITATGVMQCGG
jgi:Flp pilus assembly protein TadG